MGNTSPPNPALSPIPTSSISAAERRRTAQANANTAGRLQVVRTTAANWGKGLAGILAVIVGFGLIKGPTEISGLQRMWAIAVGVLLALALLSGVFAAFRLMRAAFGSTTARPIGPGGLTAAEDSETADSVAALNHGICAALGALLFLMLAVGATWYGPVKADPVVRIGVAPGADFVCGTVKFVTDTALEVETKNGTQRVSTTEITTLSATESCP